MTTVQQRPHTGLQSPQRNEPSQRLGAPKREDEMLERQRIDADARVEEGSAPGPAATVTPRAAGHVVRQNRQRASTAEAGLRARIAGNGLGQGAPGARGGLGAQGGQPVAPAATEASTFVPAAPFAGPSVPMGIHNAGRATSAVGLPPPVESAPPDPQLVAGQLQNALQAANLTLADVANPQRMPALQQAAAQNPQLAGLLAQLAAHPEVAFAAGYGPNTRTQAVGSAVQALQGLNDNQLVALANAEPTLVGHLARALEDTELAGSAASDVLGRLAARNVPAARDVLRTMAGQADENGTAGRTADALASIPAGQLTPDDVRAIFNGAGHGTAFGAGNAARTFVEQHAATDPTLLGAARDALRGNATWEGAQATATTVLGRRPDATADDVKLLDGAVRDPNVASPRSGALSALSRLATRQPPAENAADTLGAAANHLRDTGAPEAAAAGRLVVDAFQNAESEQAKNDLAGYALQRNHIPNDVAVDAIGRARHRANVGDEVAIDGLADAMSNARLQLGGAAGPASDALAGAMRGNNPRAREAMTNALTQGDPVTARVAARAFSQRALAGDADAMRTLVDTYGTSERTAAKDAARSGLERILQDTPNNHPLGVQAREALRAQVGTDRHAARALGRLGQRATNEDIDALSRALGSGHGDIAAESLQNIATVGGPAQRERVLTRAREALGGESEEMRRRGAALFGALAPSLTAADVRSLQSASMSDEVRAQVQQQILVAGSTEAKRELASSLATRADQFRRLPNPVQLAAVRAARAQPPLPARDGQPARPGLPALPGLANLEGFARHLIGGVLQAAEQGLARLTRQAQTATAAASDIARGDLASAIDRTLNSDGDRIALQIDAHGSVSVYGPINVGVQGTMQAHIQRVGDRYQVRVSGELAASLGVELVEDVEANGLLGAGGGAVFDFATPAEAARGVRALALTALAAPAGPLAGVVEHVARAGGVAADAVHEASRPGSFIRDVGTGVATFYGSVLAGPLGGRVANLLANDAADGAHAVSGEVAPGLRAVADGIRDARQFLAGRLDHVEGRMFAQLNGRLRGGADDLIAPGLSLDGLRPGLEANLRAQTAVRWYPPRNGNGARLEVESSANVRGHLDAQIGVGGNLTAQGGAALVTSYTQGNGGWSVDAARSGLRLNADLRGRLSAGLGVSLHGGAGRELSVFVPVSSLQTTFGGNAANRAAAMRDLTAFMNGNPGPLFTRIGSVPVDVKVQDRFELGLSARAGYSQAGTGGYVTGSLDWEDRDPPTYDQRAPIAQHGQNAADWLRRQADLFRAFLQQQGMVAAGGG